jgi:hypothetical protein
MRLKGKAITGTSLLMMLGVVCFATILVSAIALTSNTLQFTSTTVTEGSITLSSTSTPGEILVGNAAPYGFNAVVNNDLTVASISVDIASVGISQSNITSATISYDGAGAVALTFGSNPSGHLVYSYSVGTQTAATVPVVVTITYALAGTYSVSATMTGTA